MISNSQPQTAIQVRAYPVPAAVEPCEAMTTAPFRIAYPDLMTEEELIAYLRIPQVSKAKDYINVIENLMRKWDLPCIHISHKRLFPLEAIKRWVMAQISKEVA